LIFGEWEEQSPWEPFGVRRGVGPEALSGFATTGTEDIVDVTARTAADLVHVIARSIAYPAQAIVVSQVGGEVLLCLCPSWAEMISHEFSSVEDLQAEVWRHANVPRDWFPVGYDAALAERGLFDERGDVRVVPDLSNIHIVVAGGMSNLHAFLFRGAGPDHVVTQSLDGI
jgi:hypothetical protein